MGERRRARLQSLVGPGRGGVPEAEVLALVSSALEYAELHDLPTASIGEEFHPPTVAYWLDEILEHAERHRSSDAAAHLIERAQAIGGLSEEA